MPVFPKALVFQERGLQGFRDLRYPQMKKLDIIFKFAAELLNLVESGLEFGIVAINLGAKPEIISGIAVSSISPFPCFIFIKRLPQHSRFFQIVFTVFPFIDEGVALLLNGFPVFVYPWIIIIFKKFIQVPCCADFYRNCFRWSGDPRLPEVMWI